MPGLTHIVTLVYKKPILGLSPPRRISLAVDGSPAVGEHRGLAQETQELASHTISCVDTGPSIHESVC
jgi:hypothetical protein